MQELEMLTSFRRRLRQGTELESLRREIEEIVFARRQRRGAHTEWARLCEDAGLMSLAFSELQLALRDNRDDNVATFRLAQHYRERGDALRALTLFERLLELEPANEDWLHEYVEILEEEEGRPRADQAIDRAIAAGLSNDKARGLRSMLQRSAADEPVAEQSRDETAWMPTDADCVRFHTLFNGREGVYARQWCRKGGDGGYSPVHEPLTPRVIRDHLLGSYTIGVYPVRLDGTATFFALDLDINKASLQRAHCDHRFAQSLRDALNQEGPRLAQVLQQLGFQPLLENSGYKGRHLWVFLQQPETAETLHLFGRLLVAWQSELLPSDLHLEFFPKQARLKGKKLGNLIKLPLGIHRHTGRRSLLLDDAGSPVLDPFERLREVSLTARSALYAAIERLKGVAVSTTRPSAARSADAESEEEVGEESQPKGPAPPPRAPVWTEADFEVDRRMKHLLAECPALAELKRTATEHRRLSHEEQLVLIHSLGHVEGGPQAVNYLLGKCVDVGPEKFMKGRLKGNPVSCPSIRKKIPHITRRVDCRCPFEFAKDRYPTPVLHLLTLPAESLAKPAPPQQASLSTLAERWTLLERRRKEFEQEWHTLRDAFVSALKDSPERVAGCGGGVYRLVETDGVEELVWEAQATEG